MPVSRTVLPAPKLLNLISVRADENAITLTARTSSRVSRCPVCAKQSLRVDSRYTRILAWQGILVTLHVRVRRFFCDERTCHRTIDDLREAFIRRRQALRSANPATRQIVHACLLRPRRGSGISFSERPRGRDLRRHSVKPHPLDATSEAQDAQGIERGRLHFPSWDPLRNRPSGSRTSGEGVGLLALLAPRCTGDSRISSTEETTVLAFLFWSLSVLSSSLLMASNLGRPCVEISFSQSPCLRAWFSEFLM